MTATSTEGQGEDMPNILLHNEIHIGCSDQILSDFTSNVEQLRGRTFDLVASRVNSEDELERLCIEVFAIPWPIVGLNSVLSVGSELTWIDSTRNFLTVVHDVDSANSTVLEALAWLLIRIVHRMRGAGDHYAVAFPADGRTDEIRALLDHENERLSAPPTFPWSTRSDPIPIIDHRTDRPPTPSQAS